MKQSLRKKVSSKKVFILSKDFVLRRAVSENRTVVKLLNVRTLQEYQLTGVLSEIVVSFKKPQTIMTALDPYLVHFKSREELLRVFNPLIQDLVGRKILEVVSSQRLT
jgi:hypothetical protein